MKRIVFFDTIVHSFSNSYTILQTISEIDKGINYEYLLENLEYSMNARKDEGTWQSNLRKSITSVLPCGH